MKKEENETKTNESNSMQAINEKIIKLLSEINEKIPGLQKGFIPKEGTYPQQSNFADYMKNFNNMVGGFFGASSNLYGNNFSNMPSKFIISNIIVPRLQEISTRLQTNGNNINICIRLLNSMIYQFNMFNMTGNPQAFYWEDTTNNKKDD